jgi:hypothetical protein
MPPGIEWVGIHLTSPSSNASANASDDAKNALVGARNGVNGSKRQGKETRLRIRT